MNAVVLCSHLPGEGHFRSTRFKVVPIECVDPYDYWRGVAYWWGSGRTIVGIEHDMEVSDAHVRELIDCPNSLCAWAYHCHFASTGLPRDVIAAGTGSRDSGLTSDPEYLTGGERWAAWSAIGVVKIAAQARLGPLRRESWQLLELSVHDAVHRPWHIHGNAVGGADLIHHHHW